VEPVRDKGLYPSHVVHQITASLPPQGVNITSLKAENGVINIVGESSNANVGRQFGARLFASKLVEDYTWTWLQRPTEDARKRDGTAAFRIQGKFKYGWGVATAK
jgi:hypothetical protein